jgi:hypothetical protein
MNRLLLRLWREESGGELVEFALSIWIWFGITFLIMYGSFALYTAHFVANAADQAARYAVVRGSTWDGVSCASPSSVECTATTTDIANYVVAKLPPGLSSSRLSVSA